jgi:hypothetical protein
MAVLTIVSATVAINYYEQLSSLIGDFGLGKLAGPMVPLLVVFAVTLLALRSAVDKLVRGNMKFPQIIDRAGSAVFALISSLVITGMIMLGFQMAPMGEKILGYTRCPDAAKPQERNNWYPMGDKLAVSLFTQGSKYCFSGDNNFQQIHPDFLGELQFNRMVPADYKGSRQEAAKDAIQIENVWTMGHEIKTDKGDLTAGSGELFLAVRINIKPGSGKRGGYGAADVDRAIRLSLGQVRMVGFDTGSRFSEGYSRYPRAFVDPASGRIKQGNLSEGIFFAAGGMAVIDLIFEWPEKIKDTPPLFVEFKRSARADVDSKKLISALQG